MSKINKTEDILKNKTLEMMDRLGFSSTVEIVENPNSNIKVISIQSEENLGILIGRNGQNLRCLEHLIRLTSIRDISDDTMFIVDINDYRKSRTNYLVEKAKNIASRVVSSGRAEALFPMSSYERRLVHMELASNDSIETESIGDEPKRRVIVKPAYRDNL